MISVQKIPFSKKKIVSSKFFICAWIFLRNTKKEKINKKENIRLVIKNYWCFLLKVSFKYGISIVFDHQSSIFLLVHFFFAFLRKIHAQMKNLLKTYFFFAERNCLYWNIVEKLENWKFLAIFKDWFDYARLKKSARLHIPIKRESWRHWYSIILLANFNLYTT